MWNNKEITTESKSIASKRNLFRTGIESKSTFWKYFFGEGIHFLQDLLNRDGKFLSLKNFQRKYNVQLNYLKYF